MSTEKKPVTIIIYRQVKAGFEITFEEVVKQWIQRAVTFPGYLGVNMLKPYPGERRYAAILKFDTHDDWLKFSEWDEFQWFSKNIEKFLEKESEIQLETGLETWFTPLGSHIAKVPPRWKMACVTFLGVCISSLFLRFTLTPQIKDFHWTISFVIFNAVIVAVLTWVVMPRLNKWANPWLRPENKVERVPEPLITRAELQK